MFSVSFYYPFLPLFYIYFCFLSINYSCCRNSIFYISIFLPVFPFLIRFLFFSSCLTLFAIMFPASFYYSFLPSLIFLFMIFVFLFLLFYLFPHFHSLPLFSLFAFAFRCIFVMQKPRLSTNSFPQFLHSRVLYYQSLHLHYLYFLFSLQ